jgi:hypothetical protein
MTACRTGDGAVECGDVKIVVSPLDERPGSKAETVA